MICFNPRPAYPSASAVTDLIGVIKLAELASWHLGGAGRASTFAAKLPHCGHSAVMRRAFFSFQARAITDLISIVIVSALAL